MVTAKQAAAGVGILAAGFVVGWALRCVLSPCPTPGCPPRPPDGLCVQTTAGCPPGTVGPDADGWCAPSGCNCEQECPCSECGPNCPSGYTCQPPLSCATCADIGCSGSCNCEEQCPCPGCASCCPEPEPCPSCPGNQVPALNYPVAPGTPTLCPPGYYADPTGDGCCAPVTCGPGEVPTLLDGSCPGGTTFDYATGCCAPLG